MAAEPQKTVLVVEPQLADEFAIPEPVLTSHFPEARVVSLKFRSIRELRERLRLEQREHGEFGCIILPFKYRYLRRPFYSVVLASVLADGGSRVRLLSSAGYLVDPFVELARRFAMALQPAISALILLRVPYLFVTQIAGNFARTRELLDDEIIGFGERKGVGGAIYWRYMANKAARFGAFGLAHDGYMGVPVGLHGWPLATYVLQKAGYRGLVYLSVALTAVGLGWLAGISGHPMSIVIVPFIIFSTYYVFNVYVGTWEVLAWGFGALALAASETGLSPLAGAFMGAAVLSHPAVGALTSLLLCARVLAAGDAFHPLLGMAVGGTLATAWWVVPYWRASGKLGRVQMINSVWTHVNVWTAKTLYALFGCCVLFAAALVTHGPTPTVLVLLLPLAVLYYNTKIRWVFSEYTAFNFILLTGASYVLTNPHWATLLVYLLIINTSSEVLWRRGRSALGFDLTPIRLGGTRVRLMATLGGLTQGRVAFELGRTRAHPGWDAAAVIGYVLSDTNVAAFNVAYTEIGEYAVYDKYCRYFNKDATRDEFETACKEGAVKYIVAFTEEFEGQLATWGYRRLAELEGLCLSPLPDGPPTRLAVFELPWEANIVHPPTKYELEPNRIRISVQANQEYLVRLTCFAGWRASQDGVHIELVDRHPGMAFCPSRDGEVELKYSFRNYWRR